jgi:rubrerythrin
MRVALDKHGRITLSDFSAVQAYKAAIRMEIQGIEFYKALRDQVKTKDVCLEIDFLIQQERSHKEVFESLLALEKEVSDDTFEEDDIVAYLNSKVFDDTRQGASAQQMNERQTSLEEAMNMERRSIVFYEGCLAQTEDAKARAALEKIVAEEKKHLAKFAEFVRIKCIDSGKGCIF